MTYRGRAVLVTGASRGIGRALALELAAEGARLALVARDGQALAEVAEECRRRGGEALALAADLAREEEARGTVVQAIAALGGLDALVVNAGVTMWAAFEQLEDLALFERLLRINFLSPVWMVHAALGELRRSRGQIVAVASVAGLAGVPQRTAYAASKHALIGFLDSLRIELTGSGVAVTVVAPDFVASGMHTRALGADGRPTGRDLAHRARVMSAEQCARAIREAMAKRRRLAVLSRRGRLGRVVRLFLPGLIDRVAARAVAAQE